MAGVTCYVYNDVYANVIAKAGRNEVQLGSVLAEGHLEPPQHRYELASDEAVIDSVWVPLHPAAPLNKKRKQGLLSPSSLSNTLPMLWCVLLLGQSRVFSPLPIDIDTPKFTAIARGNNSVWGATDSKLVEYTLSGPTGLTINSEPANLLKELAVNAPKKLLKPTPQLFCAIADDSVGIYKTTRKTANPTFLLDFAPTLVAQLARILTIVFANSDRVHARDIETLNHATYNVSGLLNITSLYTVSKAGYDHLFVCGTGGVFGYRIDFIDLATNERPLWRWSTETPVLQVYYHATGLKAVVYQGIDPVLVDLEWDDEKPAKYIVDTPTPQPQPEDRRSLLLLELPETNGSVVDGAEITPERLHQRLVAALDEDSTQSVAICASCNDDTVIKETVKRFRPVPAPLFEAVAEEVALDPLLLLLSLSTWLKWLLLLHGGALAKNPLVVPTLQRLQLGLDEGMKVLSHLLALQGRLQLLNCQGQLREEEEDDDEDEDEVPAPQPVADIEYANGEAE